MVPPQIPLDFFLQQAACDAQADMADETYCVMMSTLLLPCSRGATIFAGILLI
jgi:hypothetical protein